MEEVGHCISCVGAALSSLIEYLFACRIFSLTECSKCFSDKGCLYGFPRAVELANIFCFEVCSLLLAEPQEL